MTEEGPTTVTGSEESKSHRQISLFGVFSIAAGAMISSGLFVLPGLAFAKAGPAMILSYGIASLLVIPVLFAKIELATAMPKSGGNYFFVERSLGPLFGSLAGFSDWFSIALKATFALVGLGALGSVILDSHSPWVLKAGALCGCLFFAGLNVLGTKKSERLQSGLVIGLLIVIATYIATGFPHVEGRSYLNFTAKGWQAILAVAGMVFVSFGGLTKVVAVAEEVENPKRNLPLGMFLAYGVVSTLYILVVFITVGLVPADSLSGSLTPLGLGASHSMGEWGVRLVSGGAFLAFATTGNSGIMAASRTPMAMSRDGLLPEFLSRIHARFQTPVLSIFVTGLFMSGLIIFLSVEDLVKTASTMMILMFMMVNISVIIMRKSGVENYRPTFKSPLCPWLQIAATVFYAFLIAEMGRVPLIITASFVAFALFWYFGYVHTRIDRQSALMFLVKRIMSRHIKRARLDEELVQILIERDNVTFDRFDKLVQESPILDIKESIGVKELFKRIAEVCDERLHLSADEFYELFLAREREGSTVIQPGLAIPHIIVPGEGIFDLVLVRCREGIIFSELHTPVKTAFVLIGSRDERNYHLRALMSIAHIVQEPDFEARWLEAKDANQLRDLLLLSGREREPA
ncbi:MAG: amino acid permease [Planctomycetota bacterium]|jgi:amino acid transporter/mannitol/fructose-specific phosphotransferase system IIA component (Ntr-type)